MHRICVFCGSNRGNHPDYAAAAASLGKLMAERGISLVYGGGRVGLMGLLADAVLAAGGEVIGIIPEHLAHKEVAHFGLADLRIVKSMHERKALMAELSDGFIALPGGFGTFEEFFEIVTWLQLGLHRKPAGLLNIRNYFNPMLQQIAVAVTEGFILLDHAKLIAEASDPGMLLAAMDNFQPPSLPKWITTTAQA